MAKNIINSTIIRLRGQADDSLNANCYGISKTHEAHILISPFSCSTRVRASNYQHISIISLIPLTQMDIKLNINRTFKLYNTKCVTVAPSIIITFKLLFELELRNCMISFLSTMSGPFRLIFVYTIHTYLFFSLRRANNQLRKKRKKLKRNIILIGGQLIKRCIGVKTKTGSSKIIRSHDNKWTKKFQQFVAFFIAKHWKCLCPFSRQKRKKKLPVYCPTLLMEPLNFLPRAVFRQQQLVYPTWMCTLTMVYDLHEHHSHNLTTQICSISNDQYE